MKKLLELRKEVEHRLAHRLAHGEHLAHVVYLGGATFAAHELAHYAEIAGFALVLGHFVLSGWEGR